MKVKLNQACERGQPGDVVDVSEFCDARRMVITGVASEIPGETLAPAPKKAKKAKKK